MTTLTPQTMTVYTSSPSVVILTPAQARIARALATTREKARTLWADGYKAFPTSIRLVYTVVSPEGKRYTVDAAGETCTCEQFARCGECKHQLAVCHKVRAAAAFLTFAPPAVPVPVAVPTSRTGVLFRENWGEGHERPVVFRLVRADLAGDVSQGGKVFDSLDAARDWAKENNVCVETYRRRDYCGV